MEKQLSKQENFNNIIISALTLKGQRFLVMCLDNKRRIDTIKSFIEIINFIKIPVGIKVECNNESLTFSNGNVIKFSIRE